MSDLPGRWFAADDSLYRRLDRLRLVGVEFLFESVDAAGGFGVTLEPIDPVLIPLAQVADGSAELVDPGVQAGVFGAAHGLPVHQRVIELGAEVADLVEGGAPR